VTNTTDTVAAAGSSIRVNTWQFDIENVRHPSQAQWCEWEGGPAVLCTGCRNAGDHNQMVHVAHGCRCGAPALYGDPFVPFPSQTHCGSCSFTDGVFRVDLSKQRRYTKLQSKKESNEIAQVLNEVIEQICIEQICIEQICKPQPPVTGSVLSSSTGVTCSLPSTVLAEMNNNPLMAQAVKRCGFVSLRDGGSVVHRSTNVNPPPRHCFFLLFVFSFKY